MHKESPFQKRSGIFLFITLIATICVAIFFPILNYGWLSVEDSSYYSTNPLFGSASLTDRLVASWKIAPESNYMPITWDFAIILSKATNHSAQAFHLNSLLVHILNSSLAFILLRRWKISPILAALAVLLFAVHPLRVESVAWASSLKGLLASLFILLALIVQTSKQSQYRAPLIILCFTLSLLCKQTLFLLPAVLFLLHLAKLKLKLKLELELSLKKTNYAILAILAGAAAFTASAINADNPMLAIHTFTNGSISPLRGLAALGHYLQQHLLPSALIPEYTASTSSLMITIGIIGLSPLLLWIRHLISKTPPSMALVCYSSFIVLILPVLGFITTPLEFAADRLTYLPSLFFWTACILSIRKIFTSSLAQKISLSACALVIIAYSTLSIKQVTVWKNDTSLTTHILKHSPNHFLATLQVANKLAVAGDLEPALTHASKLIHIHPERYAGWQTFTRIHISLGSAEKTLPLLDERLTLETPIRSGLQLLRTESLRTLTRYPESIIAADLAAKAGADLATVHYHKALTYHQARNLTEAKKQLQQALKLKPNSPTFLALKKQIDQQ